MDQAERLRNVVKQKSREAFPNNARVVTVTSGKGGVGKTSVTVNLAVCLRKMDYRVIIFDADLGLANVEVMFGAVSRYNLSDVIYRGKKINEVITQGPMDIGFVSSGLGTTGLNNLSKDQILYLVHSLAELSGMADVILIDTGAGISDNVLEFVMASPEIFLVTTPEPSSLTDAYSLLKALYRNPVFCKEKTKINVVANKVHSASEGDAVFSKLNSVVSQFLKGEIEFLGMIPFDYEMDKAVRDQKLVSIEKPNASSSKAFQILANNLIKHENKILNMRKGIAQIMIHFLSRRGG